MKKIFGILVLTLLSGCASYESTYWRHPDTGATVECEASWKALDQAPMRRYECEELMRRAGLRPIKRDEGKAWEATR